MSERQGPLSGVKVIELAHIMAGPVCGLMMADMGADVIKVEKVPGGDDSRRFVPPTYGDEAAAFMMMNRNKRGIALDLKNEDGKEILRRLLIDADVVIENYRLGTMEKLGFGYESLKEINPALIYVELSGFGRTGPYADRGGFDLIAQGMSGLMSLTGEEPGRPPCKVGPPVTDITAGIIAAMGALAAYTHRLKTGDGQKVDTSLFEAGITQTYWQSAIALATGIAPGPMGSAHPLNAPYQAFQTSDGWVTLGAANQRNWLRMLDALDRTELSKDPRFVDNHSRIKRQKELADVLGSVLREKTTEEWLERMELAGVPAGPILDVCQMHKNPQTIARDMVVEVEHTTEGKVKTLGLPVKFSKTPGKVVHGAPLYGEHTRDVLAELGYSIEQVKKLEGAGVITVQ
jgi:crotonobetainyl-CoA:carnitine CoA-transferase CaiB-like acyl-CoA transferase